MSTDAPPAIWQPATAEEAASNLVKSNTNSSTGSANLGCPISLQSTASRGRAVFASKDIDAGTTIVKEAPCCAMQSLGSEANRQGLLLACGHPGCLAPIPAIGTQLGMLAQKLTRQDLAMSYDSGEGCGSGSGSGSGNGDGKDSDCMVGVGRLNRPLNDPKSGLGGSGVLVDWHSDGKEVEEGIAPVFGCPNNCGAVYCSSKCRDLAEASGHRFLCVGRVVQRITHGIETDSVLHPERYSGDGEGPAEQLERVLQAHPLLRFKQYVIETNEVFLMAAQVGTSTNAR